MARLTIGEVENAKLPTAVERKKGPERTHDALSRRYGESVLTMNRKAVEKRNIKIEDATLRSQSQDNGADAQSDQATCHPANQIRRPQEGGNPWAENIEHITQPNIKPTRRN